MVKHFLHITRFANDISPGQLPDQLMVVRQAESQEVLLEHIIDNVDSVEQLLLGEINEERLVRASGSEQVQDQVLHLLVK